MKLKYLLLLLLLFTFHALNAQAVPGTYIMEGKILEKGASENPVSNSITDIITIGDTVWLGTSRGASKSEDRGLSWTNYYRNEVFSEENVAALAYSKGIVFATTAHSIEKNGEVVSEGSGVRISMDRGNTWKYVPQPLDSLNDSVVVYGINRIRTLPVTVAGQNVSYDIAVSNGTIWIASFAGGLRKSTDYGDSWQRVVLPPDGLNNIKPTDTLNFTLSPVSGNLGFQSNLNHRVFSVVTGDSSTIWVGTAGGINKSTDGGVSWRKFNHLNQTRSISGNFVVALAYNPANKSIWAATWKAEEQSEFYAVSFSTDGGETWQTTLNGEKVHNFGFKGSETIAVSDNGVFRTNNMGASWILASSIVDNITKVSLPGGPFYSAASEGSDVWIGSDKGTAKITENGGIWNGIWKVFIASQPLASTSDTYAFPNPFSPDVEPVNIKYSTGGNSETVTIRIFDFGMNLVRTVVQNAVRGNQVHTIEGSSTKKNGVIDRWDGRDDKGNLVANGVYFYRVDVGSKAPVYGKIMVLM